MHAVLHRLQGKRVVLASGSPRRRELLENLGLNVHLCPSKFEENLKPDDYPSIAEFVEKTAFFKVQEVADRLKSTETSDVIIGADTMVTMDGVLYGKPKDAQDAMDTLSRLAGKPHTVYTGVAIKAGTKFVTFSEKTKVFMGQLTKEDIEAYVNTGEPLDKAGSYGIQGKGGMLIERVEGDYFTVIGLPLYRLSQKLKDILN